MQWRTITVWLSVFFSCSTSLLLTTACAGEKKPLEVADFLDWEDVLDPQISPDGTQVVYTRRWVDKLKDRWTSELWIVNRDGTKNRRLIEGAAARWSPDGTRLAFVRDAEAEKPQIFVHWMDAEGAVSQVTRLEQSPANLRWSPDGKQIAFTMLVEDKNKWDLNLPKAPEGAKWTEPPKIIEKTHYRQDQRGFMKEGWVHLFVVTADGGTPRRLTEGDWHVGARPTGLDYGIGLEWTPDGSEIVFDALKADDADRRFRESHIYAVNLGSGAIRQITKERGPWTSPVVSPDGRLIAFAGFAWTPQTYKAAEISVIAIDGTGQRKVSGDLDRDPADLHWSPDGTGVYFAAGDRGSRNLHFASLDGVTRAVTEGVHMLSLDSLSTDGHAAGVRTSFHAPSDVVVLSVSAPSEIKQLTRVNDDVLAQRKLGEVEEIWYESTGGTKVQGWIVKPPDFDSAEKYPLILHIHGGPHAMYDVSFNFSFQQLAAAGYVVLYTNPRGSTGYGTDFGNAIDNAYPSVDYDDLMAGVDVVLQRGNIDPKRMYVTGVSGGGVLSSWIVGHTDRFAAAAVRAPVINWISFAGTTDITSWGFYRFRPAYWDDPQLWLAHSPLMYVKNVKTPTLLMTGELDLRTPMGQTEEYYQALRQLGVPTALVRFNGEYHGTGSKPSNFMRTQLYLLKWFGEHTLDAPKTAQSEKQARTDRPAREGVERTTAQHVSVGGAHQIPDSEREAIKQTALDYIEGWYEGNAERMEHSLHPELAKRALWFDPRSSRMKIDHMGAMTLVQRTRSRGDKAVSASEQSRAVEILDVFGNAASVKVVANDWVDYLHMTRLDGRWQIVNVLWELKPEAKGRNNFPPGS